MSFRSALESYLRIHPIGIGNASRLSAAYAASLMMRLLAPGRFKSVGDLIPGESMLTVSVAGIKANVRPRTNDLGTMAADIEPETATWFQVNPGDIVVDVGAHIGRYSLVAARYAEIVIAIEPEPSNFSMLQTNISLNEFSNIVALPVAVSKGRGKARLLVPGEGDTALSSIERGWLEKMSVSEGHQEIEVECETLDDITEYHGLQRIDWLKIDVEGHETSVLRGALSTLARTRQLILEVGRANAEACARILSRAGLRLMLVEEHVGTPTSNWLLVRRHDQEKS